MDPFKPKQKNADGILLLAAILSCLVALACLAFSLKAYLQGAIEAQRNYPTPTPALYHNFVDLAYRLCFRTVPELGVGYLLIAVCIWRYRRVRKKNAQSSRYVT